MSSVSRAIRSLVNLVPRGAGLTTELVNVARNFSLKNVRVTYLTFSEADASRVQKLVPLGVRVLSASNLSDGVTRGGPDSVLLAEPMAIGVAVARARDEARLHAIKELQRLREDVNNRILNLTLELEKEV